MLGALGLEVVLGEEDVVEAELVGEDALADLGDGLALGAFVALLQGAVEDPDALRGQDGGAVSGAVLEDGDLQHGIPLCSAGRPRARHRFRV